MKDQLLWKLKYFLEAWEFKGVGNVIAGVQDSPNSVVQLEVSDIEEIIYLLEH